MDNLQDTLFFPFRDIESRNQFLIACAIMVAAFIVPILPTLILMGYSAKIMRQIVEEKKAPSMPAWQGSDWSDMLLDGVRLYCAQFVLMLPLLLPMGCGMVFLMGGSFAIPALAEDHISAIAPIGMLLMMVGSLFLGSFGILSLPYSVIVSAALPHVAIRRSFQAAFQFGEWFLIFRKGLGQFILGYAIILIASFVFVFIMQFAMMTIILICVIPILMIPYMAYQILIMNAVYAQAYAAGRDGLQAV